MEAMYDDIVQQCERNMQLLAGLKTMPDNEL